MLAVGKAVLETNQWSRSDWIQSFQSSRLEITFWKFKEGEDSPHLYNLVVGWMDGFQSEILQWGKLWRSANISISQTYRYRPKCLEQTDKSIGPVCNPLL